MTSAKEDFFSHLRLQKTFHVFVCSETEQPDPALTDDWRQEGYNAVHVPFGAGGVEFVHKVRALADKTVGVSEQYALVTYGRPGTPLIHSLRQMPRLAALIAFYPPQLPSPNSTPYPPSIQVQIHLCDNTTISIHRRSEVLGLQTSRASTHPKTVHPGPGLGSSISLGRSDRADAEHVRAWTYPQPLGFAEADHTAFSSTARDLAWSRALGCVRSVARLGSGPDLGAGRDAFLDAVGRDPAALLRPNADIVAQDGPSRINVPTLTGGFDRDGLGRFYRDLFGPSAAGMRATLISRTVGPAGLADEMVLEFVHDRVVEWILPGVKPTGKKVRVPLVAVVGMRGGRVYAERVYWDQAGVLVQIGMLDPRLVPKGFRGQKMPVMGKEQASAVAEGEDWEGSLNALLDGLDV